MEVPWSVALSLADEALKVLMRPVSCDMASLAGLVGQKMERDEITQPSSVFRSVY